MPPRVSEVQKLSGQKVQRCHQGHVGEDDEDVSEGVIDVGVIVTNGVIVGESQSELGCGTLSISNFLFSFP